MEEHADQQFLRSVFLMEAWDTLAAIEEGIARLTLDAAPADELFVLTHRLKGTALLYGFVEVAGLAESMEQVLSSMPPASAEGRGGAIERLRTLAGDLKSSLETIGAARETADRHGGSPVDPVRAELDTFFANREVLEYFRPEAIEHLDTMAAVLGELGRHGATEEEIGRLFRTVHTLKGSALVVGCDPIGNVAHRLEDLLGEVRAGRIHLTPATIYTMFTTV